MKYLIIFLIIPVFAKSQTGITVLRSNDTIKGPSVVFGGSGIYPGFSTVYPQLDSYKVISKYDTVVRYPGSDTCKHDFVKKDIRVSKMWTCLVNHGPEGCFDTWLHDDVICYKCLKNFEVM